MKLIGFVIENGPKQRAKITKDDGIQVEVTHRLKLSVKKERYDKDENAIEGTGNPWMTLTVETWDEQVLKEFKDKKIGSKVKIEVTI